MKRILFLTFGLLAISLACQAVQAGFATPTPTAEPTFTPTVTSTPAPTLTPLPPTPAPITCDDETCLQACLDRIKVVLEAQPFVPLDENRSNGNSTVDLMRYKVNGDEISLLSKLGVSSSYAPYQEDVEAQQRIWNYFAAILPAEQRKWIVEYLVFTDGKSNKMAWVRSSPSDLSKWTIGADILDSRNPVALTDTLLHEFGHLLSLNSEQVTQSSQYTYNGRQGTSACPQYGTFEGCTTPDSYMNAFYQTYWKKIYPEWYKNVYEAGRGYLDWELVSGFYRRYPDQFNSVYSASKPEEDLAESFAAFVLKPKPDGRSIAAQKVLFFYDYPELVDLRQSIIQGICSYVQE